MNIRLRGNIGGRSAGGFARGPDGSPAALGERPVDDAEAGSGTSDH
jgi:hypothetical protein